MLGIYAIQKFSTLDFPNKLSCILWFSGCNMRCPYCYNKDVVFGEKLIEEEEVLKFLKKRIGLLDGVVFTGGEATLYKNIISFATTIKELGFDIKLDTNGVADTGFGTNGIINILKEDKNIIGNSIFIYNNELILSGIQDNPFQIVISKYK